MYEAALALAMAVPSFFHWNVGAGVPLAAATNVTELPRMTASPAGWVVIVGAIAVAPLLDDELEELLELEDDEEEELELDELELELLLEELDDEELEELELLEPVTVIV